jgi:hypothetical protein
MSRSFVTAHAQTDLVNELTRAIAQAAVLTRSLAEVVFGRDEAQGVALVADAIRAKWVAVRVKANALLEAVR